MPRLTRRDVIKALPLGLVAGASACGDDQVYCSPLQDYCIGQPAPDWMYRAWNDPENEAAASRQPPPVHMGNIGLLGVTVSPDGSLAAMPVMRRPVNEIAVIELSTSRAWRIAHPNPRVALMHPTFAPNGDALAFVVTPPTYLGVGEIWISTPRGEPARVIRSLPQRSYMWPTFSWDGNAISYFRDVSPPPLPGGRPTRREYHGALSFGLFELSLSSRQETRVVHQAWNAPGLLRYGPGGEGYILVTEGPLPEARLRDEDQAELWRFRSSAGAGGTRSGANEGYVVRRGQEPPIHPVSIVPEALEDPGFTTRFAAVARDGRLLFSTANANGRGHVAVVWDGERARTAFSGANVGGTTMAMSADGETIVSTMGGVFRPGLELLVETRDRRTRHIAAEDIRWESDNLLVRATEHSELQP